MAEIGNHPSSSTNHPFFFLFHLISSYRLYIWNWQKSRLSSFDSFKISLLSDGWWSTRKEISEFTSILLGSGPEFKTRQPYKSISMLPVRRRPPSLQFAFPPDTVPLMASTLLLNSKPQPWSWFWSSFNHSVASLSILMEALHGPTKVRYRCLNSQLYSVTLKSI